VTVLATVGAAIALAAPTPLAGSEGGWTTRSFDTWLGQ
jgi:hypothetical protein